MIILSHKFCVSQVRKIRDAIENRTGIRYPILTEPKRKCQIFLRYGTTVESNLILQDTDLNSVDFISMLVDKKKFADFCETLGIFAPKFSRDTTNISFPAVIRETLTGYHGHGIHVVKNIEEFNDVWKPGFWWTPYIRMRKEYRAHIVNGTIIKIFEKLYDGDEEFPIRNNAASDWSIRNPEKFVELQKDIDKITEKIPKYFMGLDVGRTYDGRYFFIEGNSAPGVSTQTAEIFANFLIGE